MIRRLRGNTFEDISWPNGRERSDKSITPLLLNILRLSYYSVLIASIAERFIALLAG